MDRAARDSAVEYGIAHGGWFPRERLAEDGGIGVDYELKVTPDVASSQRAEWNVRDPGGTAFSQLHPN